MTTTVNFQMSPNKDKEQAQAGIIQLTKRFQVITPDERTIYDSGDTPCKSFVVAFIRALWSCFDRKIVRTPDINNIPREHINWGNRFAALMHIDGRPHIDSVGPVVGRGSTPLTNSDHRLDDQISHGGGTGQLSYGGTEIVEPIELRGAMELRVLRRLTNISPETVTITECGIYCTGALTTRPAQHCLIRDLVEPAVSVAPDHSFLLEYKIITRV